MQFVDLENLVSEDFKKDPNSYINDKGEVGKEIREQIKSSATIMKKDGTSGNLALSSDPYNDPENNDPETGQTKQDLLYISSGNSTWSVPENGNSTSGSGISSSGGNSGSNPGSIPIGTNNVTLQTIDRPDQATNAKPADNNAANGTGSATSSITGSNSGGSSSSGYSDKEDNNSPKTASGTQKGLDCAGEHKGTLACASMGEANESHFDGIEIPKKTDGTTYSSDAFLPNNGVCPAPKLFHVVGKQYQVSYEPLCNIATQIRFAVLIAFAVMAAMIAFGSLKKG